MKLIQFKLPFAPALHNKGNAYDPSNSAANGSSKRRFIHKYDPARLIYKAQCYDGGAESATTCGICGEVIRFCYVLKLLEDTTDVPSAKEIGKVVVGDCCFPPFRESNPDLHRKLLAAQVNLGTYIEAIERDKRVYGTENRPTRKRQ